MEMLRETFFMKGFITAMVIAVLTKVIVWANYHRLLVSSEEMALDRHIKKENRKLL